MIYNFAGSDPGNSNYGYGVIRVDPTSFKIKILEMGMFTCQITNLTDKEAKPPKSKRRKRIVVENYKPFSTQLRLFCSEWGEILDQYDVKAITSERFQSRGLKGLSIEVVSMMNAFICHEADSRDIAYQVITAATWKNQVNRYIDLESLYKENDLTPHMIDAVFIAVYCALKFFKLEWCDIDLHHIANQFNELHYSNKM